MFLYSVFSKPRPFVIVTIVMSTPAACLGSFFLRFPHRMDFLPMNSIIFSASKPQSLALAPSCELICQIAHWQYWKYSSPVLHMRSMEYVCIRYVRTYGRSLRPIFVRLANWSNRLQRWNGKRKKQGNLPIIFRSVFLRLIICWIVPKSSPRRSSEFILLN